MFYGKKESAYLTIPIKRGRNSCMIRSLFLGRSGEPLARDLEKQRALSSQGRATTKRAKKSIYLQFVVMRILRFERIS